MKRSEAFLLKLNEYISSGEAVEDPKGSNRGKFVDMVNKTAGVPKGSPWCASFTYAGAIGTGLYEKIELPGHPGSVYGWRTFFNKKKLITSDFSKVKRGDIAFWLDPKTLKGHIMPIAEVRTIPVIAKLFPKIGNWIRTEEGNAAPESGTREGIMALKKWRLTTSKFQFILFSDY